MSVSTMGFVVYVAVLRNNGDNTCENKKWQRYSLLSCVQKLQPLYMDGIRRTRQTAFNNEVITVLLCVCTFYTELPV